MFLPAKTIIPAVETDFPPVETNNFAFKTIFPSYGYMISNSGNASFCPLKLFLQVLKTYFPLVETYFYP